MRTIRQIYLYLVAGIALEVVVWGLVDLAASALAWRTVGGEAGLLARGLSLTLVGASVFALHWGLAQRAALQDAEERASLARAIFVYCALLVLCVAAAQNGLVLLNRLFLDGMGLTNYPTLFGAFRRPAFNAIALAVNGAFAAYFASMLRGDWSATPYSSQRAGVRRIYRYLWVVYSLSLAVAGAQQLLQYLVSLPQVVLGGSLRQAWLANGLALVAIGAPLWALSWGRVQRSLRDIEERESPLRFGMLYFLSLVAAGIVVVAGATIVSLLLRRILGEALGGADWLADMRVPLSLGLPAAVVWAYYARQLRKDLIAIGDAPHRSGVRRLYFSLLSLIGLAVTAAGSIRLGLVAVDLMSWASVWGPAMRTRLATGLAYLASGLPVWLATWLPLQAEAAAPGEAGDHARRSLTRKAYLYFTVAVGVVGTMVAGGSLLFLWLRDLLGGEPLGRLAAGRSLVWLVAFGVLLAYHAVAMRRDGLRAARALAARHARFPVLVVDGGDGTFADAVRRAVAQEAPELPLYVWRPQLSAPPRVEGEVQAVVLPATLAWEAPEDLRRWLSGFPSIRLVVPDERPGRYLWAGQAGADSPRQAARALRRLAEGQEMRATGTPGWIVAVYVLAGLAALQLLVALLGVVTGFLLRLWD
jgi:hypothetical protein